MIMRYLDPQGYLRGIKAFRAQFRVQGWGLRRKKLQNA